MRYKLVTLSTNCCFAKTKFQHLQLLRNKSPNVAALLQAILTLTLTLTLILTVIVTLETGLEKEFITRMLFKDTY